MMTSSRSALVDGLQPARAGSRLAAALAIACLSACVTAPEPQRVAAPASVPRATEDDLNARLEALQHQSEPVSDDVMASLERAVREQRERRARAMAAAGSTAAVAPAAPAAPARTIAEAPPAIAPATPPAKSARVTKPQARGASAAAVTEVAATPPPSRLADPLPPLVATNAAAVAGPSRTPMSRTSESHTPVDELYAHARELELQSQVATAIALYREASQRGHAPSSQRLMELYADGAPGVARDYRVAVFFKERAVQQGASFDVWRR